MALDHGDVFQSRGVEDDVRPLFAEQAGEARRIAHVAQQTAPRNLREALGHLALDLKERGFGTIQQGDVAAFEGGRLAAELRADRAIAAANTDSSGTIAAGGAATASSWCTAANTENIGLGIDGSVTGTADVWTCACGALTDTAAVGAP